ncbi:Alpha/Beta hydrolase protein [Leptodontidium sp. MPI-SDFR-AT-0119]|nr:Alpha/Beta hydrolase protein [Leptodontidium sp. MPI-SDFR-AT-0119]
MRSSGLLATLAAGLCTSAFSLEWRQSSNWTVGQTVQTESGPVSGHAAKNNSEVSEYLGIPYGQAPVGDLRFAAPVKFTGNASINGTSYGPNCPVKSSNSSLPSAQAIDAANVTAAGISILSLLSASGKFSEDCLNLNVWTKPQTGESKKAVLVWLYGGGFSSGASSIRGYNGANIAGQEDVVVVSFNYRLSILGFPGNPNSTANVALLDQRLAVEWVRDNIENFGGDPSRITLFGQSAGAASVDIYSYAWNSDPIAAGFIPESGNVIGWGLPNSKEFGAAAWYNVSTTLGCGNASSDSTAVLECMRKQNYTKILDSIPAASGTAGILGYFGPTEDDVVVFSNYSSRTPAKVPMLIGNNNYEGGLFRTEFALNGLFYPDKFWDAFNLQEFTCPTGIRANLSVAAGNPTWRYRYMGVFPNLAVSSEAGTWHAAELPMLFNTVPNSPPATTAQISIGNYMRGAWAAFAKDPKEGLTKYGWPVYNTSQDSLVRLGYENITGPNLINPYRYDADCVFVNVSSTDSTVAIPDIPDLGANVTPTANGTSPTPTPTGSATGTGTGSGSGTTSSSPTSTGNAGGKVAASVYLGMVGIMAAALM